jgi:hypothetical protein
MHLLADISSISSLRSDGTTEKRGRRLGARGKGPWGLIVPSPRDPPSNVNSPTDSAEDPKKKGSSG